MKVYQVMSTYIQLQQAKAQKTSLIDKIDNLNGIINSVTTTLFDVENYCKVIEKKLTSPQYFLWRRKQKVDDLKWMIDTARECNKEILSKVQPYVDDRKYLTSERYFLDNLIAGKFFELIGQEMQLSRIDKKYFKQLTLNADEFLKKAMVNGLKEY